MLLPLPGKLSVLDVGDKATDDKEEISPLLQEHIAALLLPVPTLLVVELISAERTILSPILYLTSGSATITNGILLCTTVTR